MFCFIKNDTLRHFSRIQYTTKEKKREVLHK